MADESERTLDSDHTRPSALERALTRVMPENPARRRFMGMALGTLAFAGAASWLAVARHKSLAPYFAPSTRIPPPTVLDELRLPMVGDWGSGTRPQSRVLMGMERVAARIGGYHGGWLLGDNFYFKGVQSTDDPKWDAYFEEQFDKPHLALLDWYAVLGNHDYMGNAEAQIAYSGDAPDGRDTQWRMPNHFYRKDYRGGGVAQHTMLTVLALDTNHEWYEQGDNAARMLAWLDAQLAELVGVSHRVVVVGHHPLVTYSKSPPEPFMVDEVMPRLIAFKPAAYICGHNHCMEHIEHEGLTCIVVGCGGKTLYDIGEGPGLKFAKKAHGFGLLRMKLGAFSFEFRDARGDVVHRIDSRALPSSGKQHARKRELLW